MATIFNPQFYISFLFIGISAFINSFLIYFASRIRPRSIDIILIITIASVELIVPAFKTANAVYSIVTEGNVILTVGGCQVIGVLINIIYFFEIALSFLLANVRLAKVTNKPLTKKFLIPFFSISSIFPILIFWMAANKEMEPYPSNITCFASPHVSPLSAITFYYFVIYTYATTFGIVYTYLKLSHQIIKAYEFVDLELRNSNNNGETKQRPWNYKFAALKIYLIVIFYATFMLLSCSLLLVSMYTEDSSPFMVMFRKMTDFICILFFLIGITSNSILLIVLHTGISKELSMFLNRFRRPRLSN